jgi:hypothetical protein
MMNLPIMGGKLIERLMLTHPGGGGGGGKGSGRDV